MKKAGLIALVALLLSGCSLAQFLPASPTSPPPPPGPSATVFLSATPTATITPTLPTPTFTGTPTLIYLNGTPTPSLTSTPPSTPGGPPSATAAASDTPQAVAVSGPFTSIIVSGAQLFWGSCEPASIEATVKVSEAVPAAGVLIMLRLESTDGQQGTAWGGGAVMEKQGGGVFTYTLTAKSFTHYREFTKAWGQYQFVAYDGNLKRIGGSSQYLNSLTIEQCP